MRAVVLATLLLLGTGGLRPAHTACRSHGACFRPRVLALFASLPPRPHCAAPCMASPMTIAPCGPQPLLSGASARDHSRRPVLRACADNAAGFQLVPSAQRLPEKIRSAPAAVCATASRTRALTLFGIRMLDEAAVSKNLEVISAGKAPSKTPTTLFKALKKTSGAVVAGCEYKRASGDLHELSIPETVDLRQVGLKVRRAKAGVVLVDCSTHAGKADCEVVVKEQLTAKGQFPGPAPVVRSGPVVAVHDVAEAKAMGCEGVVLSMKEPGADALIQACAALGMEAIAEVATAAELERATAAGVKLIACDASFRDSVPKDLGVIALLPSRTQDPAEIFSVAASEKDEAPTPEVLKALAPLKEAKFSAIICMDAMRRASSSLDTAFTLWLLEQVTSKQSGKFSKLTKTPSLGQGNPLAKPDGILYDAQ